MAIDLDQLAKVANLPGDAEVVSRSWLRQVLKELSEARTQAPSIDLGRHPLPRIGAFVGSHTAESLLTRSTAC